MSTGVEFLALAALSSAQHHISKGSRGKRGRAEIQTVSSCMFCTLSHCFTKALERQLKEILTLFFWCLCTQMPEPPQSRHRFCCRQEQVVSTTRIKMSLECSGPPYVVRACRCLSRRSPYTCCELDCVDTNRLRRTPYNSSELDYAGTRFFLRIHDTAQKQQSSAFLARCALSQHKVNARAHSKPGFCVAYARRYRRLRTHGMNSGLGCADSEPCCRDVPGSPCHPARAAYAWPDSNCHDSCRRDCRDHRALAPGHAHAHAHGPQARQDGGDRRNPLEQACLQSRAASHPSLGHP